MQLISNHLVLVAAPFIENGCSQVQDFFNKSLLLHYDRIDIQKEKCLQGNGKDFQRALQNSVEANRKTLNKFISEFEKTGFQSVSDLIEVKYGYPSKLLHIITHFLDGFIGIDTVFYNLIEDSHWVSEETRKTMNASPDTFWLIHLDCYSETPDKVALVQQ